jgi:uncharacterized membrane protein
MAVRQSTTGNRSALIALIAFSGLSLVSFASVLAQETDPSSAATAPVQKSIPDPLDFAAHVFPILKKRCLECHGPELQEAELRVDLQESMLVEDFVVPGDAANSRLYEVLISEDDDRMPPIGEHKPLPTSEIVVIKAWIDQGAKWSDISSQLSDVAVGDPLASNPQTLSPQAAYWVRVWRALGDFHPATVHFPIAMLVLGGVFALFGLRGSYRCSDFAFYCLWIGAIGAILASVLGWSFAWNEGHNEDPFAFDQSAELFWHRWTGVLLAILSFLVAVGATIARRRDPDNGTLWKLCLILLAVFTAYVGHAGGELTHRRGYRRLFELFGNNPQVQPEVKEFETRDESNGGTR